MCFRCDVDNVVMISESVEGLRNKLRKLNEAFESANF